MTTELDPQARTVIQRALRDDLAPLHDVLPALGVESQEAGDAGQPA